MPSKKVVRFAYKNIYHGHGSPPGLSYSSSTLPSSSGPITPPNRAQPLPHHYHHKQQIASRHLPVPHRYLAPGGIIWSLLDHPSLSSRRRRPLSDSALMEPAFEPALPYITLYSQYLPWPLAIHASNRRYVTVGDILISLYEQLRANVSRPEFDALSERDRRVASQAYQARYRRFRQVNPAQYQAEKNAGMKRVDFLMKYCFFAGLRPGRHGDFHLQVSAVP